MPRAPGMAVPALWAHCCLSPHLWVILARNPSSCRHPTFMQSQLPLGTEPQ